MKLREKKKIKKSKTRQEIGQSTKLKPQEEIWTNFKQRHNRNLIKEITIEKFNKKE
jgi:hypothetical protein